MNWFKITVQHGNTHYTYSGSSPHTLEALLDQATQGKYVRLDELVYIDRGEVKDWGEWDKREIPSVAINPKVIFGIMQYKADPRTLGK